MLIYSLSKFEGLGCGAWLGVGFCNKDPKTATAWDSLSKALGIPTLGSELGGPWAPCNCAHSSTKSHSKRLGEVMIGLYIPKGLKVGAS